jgi:flagellin-like protein
LLVRNGRAISPVVSNLILIAVVIVLGFAALAYARNLSNDYKTDYHELISSEINTLKEDLGFEYAFYNSSGCVQAYFINAGTISLTVDKVYLSTSSSNLTYVMKFMNGTLAPDHTLSMGAKGRCFAQQTFVQRTYTVRVTTIRGSSFAYSFSV